MRRQNRRAFRDRLAGDLLLLAVAAPGHRQWSSRRRRTTADRLHLRATPDLFNLHTHLRFNLDAPADDSPGESHI